MPIKVNNSIVNFGINTVVENYPIVDNVEIKRGDLLHFIDIDGITHITNVINGEDSIDAVAIHSSNSTNIIPCYIITYRAKYSELEAYPYIVLQQFTYGEIRRKLIKKYLSTTCNAISNNTCALLSRYTCDNLNVYGVRENPL